MPTYVYECTGCSEQTELVQKISDAPLAKCPKCGGNVRKLLFPVGIVFKGSGFHVNDYRKPDGKRETDSTAPVSKTESAAPAPKAEPTPAAAQ